MSKQSSATTVHNGFAFEPSGPDFVSVSILGVVWLDILTGDSSHNDVVVQGFGVAMRSLMSFLLFLNGVLERHGEVRGVFDPLPGFRGPVVKVGPRIWYSQSWTELDEAQHSLSFKTYLTRIVVTFGSTAVAVW